MREHFAALSARAIAHGARDNNRRLVDTMDICGNPLEDLLVQIRSQLQFASYVMRENLSPAAETQRHAIVLQILDAAARSALLICTSAHMYFGTFAMLWLSKNYDQRTVH